MGQCYKKTAHSRRGKHRGNLSYPQSVGIALYHSRSFDRPGGKGIERTPIVRDCAEIDGQTSAGDDGAPGWSRQRPDWNLRMICKQA